MYTGVPFLIVVGYRLSTTFLKAATSKETVEIETMSSNIMYVHRVHVTTNIQYVYNMFDTYYTITYADVENRDRLWGFCVHNL